jgi:hypothetical protein
MASTNAYWAAKNALGVAEGGDIVEHRDIDATEAARLIREDLGRGFPSAKFSVRSSRFSQGSSVDVSYADGPPLADVSAIAEQYGHRGFDGTDDSTYYVPAAKSALTFRGFVDVSRQLSPEMRERLQVTFDTPPYAWQNLDFRLYGDPETRFAEWRAAIAEATQRPAPEAPQAERPSSTPKRDKDPEREAFRKIAEPQP